MEHYEPTKQDLEEERRMREAGEFDEEESTPQSPYWDPGLQPWTPSFLGGRRNLQILVYLFVGLALIFVIATALGGCLQHDQYWSKAGMTPASLSQDSARCRLFARGASDKPFIAAGNERFVAGAAVGHAIGTAIATDQNFDDCMMVEGYQKLTAEKEGN